MRHREQRVRCPVHGLITFHADDPLAQLAWRLLDTTEFQRLRRIRQLGVSEFVFPSASHTRFAHCIGVFHTARQLVEVIKREVKDDFDPRRAEVAIIAALLHDLGHGPFSHTFEGVQTSRGVKKKHERWSAEIVRNPAGGVAPLLSSFRGYGSFPEDVAAMLEAEDPADIYHAVVSSSFDADRLDYLRRDRLMTGTHAGAIDFDWLMAHVRVRPVATEAADVEDDDAPAPVPTFCLDVKALPAAEQFLLARYTLHEQVYFHKTTRCVEHMIAKLLRRLAILTEEAEAAKLTGLADDHPLRRFFSQGCDTLDIYLALDDVVVMGAIGLMTRGLDHQLSQLAIRLRSRNLYKTLDMREFGHDTGKQRHKSRLIENHFRELIEQENIIKDDGAGVSIYTEIGGDDDRTHKKLHILDAGRPQEITRISPLVDVLRARKPFTRYFFENESDRNQARPCGRISRG